jgi:hypothetical protein
VNGDVFAAAVDATRSLFDAVERRVRDAVEREMETRHRLGAAQAVASPGSEPSPVPRPSSLEPAKAARGSDASVDDVSEALASASPLSGLVGDGKTPDPRGEAVDRRVPRAEAFWKRRRRDDELESRRSAAFGRRSIAANRTGVREPARADVREDDREAEGARAAEARDGGTGRAFPFRVRPGAVHVRSRVFPGGGARRDGVAALVVQNVIDRRREGGGERLAVETPILARRRAYRG